MEIDKDDVGGGDGDGAEAPTEERMMPQDMDAFFKHPLVQGDNGDAIALLHEYQTLYSAYSNRPDNSPNPLFGSNFIPKMSTCSDLASPLQAQFVPERDGSNKEDNFYKSECFGSTSSTLMAGTSNQNKINDPALPSINILSRSTFAQNHFMPSSPIKSFNSHPLSDWKCSMNAKLKTNDAGFKFSPEAINDSYESVRFRLGNSVMVCNEINSLKPDKLPPLSLLNKDVSSARTSTPSSRISFQTNQSSIVQSQQTKVSGAIESSAIDMSYQGNVQNLKTDNNSNKFLTSKQFFGDSDLIQMLEKQMPPEQFTNSVNLNSQKLHPNIPSLPFPLPEVPLGYRLVITHLPITSDQEPDSKHITQLIIDNPIVPSNSLPQNSDNQLKHQHSNLQSVVKTLDVENGNLSTTTKLHLSHHQTLQFSGNKTTNTNTDSIPTENILKKSLEEANMMTLLDQNISNNDPTSPTLELSFLQKELNLSAWQTPPSDVSSTITINSQEVSPPIKRPSYKGKANARWNHISFIPKIENDNSGFKFYLEAAISTNPKRDEDRVTYLNKSQYYGLVLQHNPPTPDFFSTSDTLKSVVMLVFRERLPVSEEMRAWECWYSRQHSYKQRVLDIDSKNSGISEDFSKPIFIEEVAHNAVSISWHKHSAVKLNLALNCLSTDFSHQKGIRGNPLHIQIDTHDGEHSTQPIHRVYCQIKVFCDKGADRKIREEEKKRSKQSEDHEHQQPCDQSYFYPMVDVVTPPVLFSPSSSSSSSQCQMLDKKNSFINPGTKRQSSENMDGLLSTKKRATDKLLLFVREESDVVFVALVVQPPSVESLAKSIQEKFLNPSIIVENIYKESRSMKVKVDDVIVSCISDESTFTIRFQHHPQNSAANETLTSCDVTLTEFRVQND